MAVTTSTRLTDAIVKDLSAPAADRKIYFDTDVAGFGVCVFASGARSFLLNYRTKAGRARRYTIGAYPSWKTAAARTEAAELKRTIDRGGDPVGDLQDKRAAPTVNELCDRFLKEVLPRKKPSTQRTYRLQIENVIRPELGRLKVADVAFADVDRLHRKITARGKAYRANRILALLSSMLTAATRWQWRSDNPCKVVERNQEHKRHRYLSADELVRLGEALPKLRDQQSAAIIGFLLLTGARRGEVLSARWDDFDDAFTTWTKPGATTKQRTEHRVPLSDAARQLLLAVREQAPKNAHWVFPAADGSPRKDVKDTWATTRELAKLKGVRLHDLRHTFASLLVSTGHDLPLIGGLLGHTQASTTQRYAHLYDDPLRRATERAAAAIANPRKALLAPTQKGRRP